MNKPKILMLPDVRGWAFSFAAESIKKHLSYKYDFTIKYFRDGSKSIKSTDIDPSQYDLIFRFVYYVMGQTKHVPKEKLLTSIRGEHSVLAIPGHFTEKVLKENYNSISIVSQKIRRLLPEKCCPTFYTPNGVDTKLFRPIADNHTDFTLGLVGNSKHPADKGWKEVKQAARFASVKLLTADRNDRWRTHEEMVDFYKKIDVLICFSKSEGAPNSPLEAAACGKAIISTDVGNVSDYVKNGETGYIVERNVSSLVGAINKMKFSKRKRDAMGLNLRDIMVKNYDWSVATKAYDEWFEFALKNQ